MGWQVAASEHCPLLATQDSTTFVGTKVYNKKVAAILGIVLANPGDRPSRESKIQVLLSCSQVTQQVLP